MYVGCLPGKANFTSTVRFATMSSPFPGMDPYIEACGLWGDFHSNLIAEIQRTVSSILPGRYVARSGERIYVECIDVREDDSFTTYFGPDVTVRTTSAVEEGAVAVARRDPNAVVMHALVEVEYREIYLEIQDLNQGHRLVTCIEVLSPVNKRPGHAGWHEYDRKREVFTRGYANFVEIDLLRGGRRRGMAERWPASPYYLLAIRKEEAPACQVWPAFMAEPLPEISIPLVPPDDDVRLAIQPLVDAIYERSRYDADIDYGRELKPPLEGEEACLLERFRQDAP